MRTHSFILFFIVLIFSCKIRPEISPQHLSYSTDSLLNRVQPCHLEGLATAWDSTTYSSMWNAAYAYEALLPKDFTMYNPDLLEHPRDTIVMINPTGRADIRYWVGEIIAVPQVKIDARIVAGIDRKMDRLLARLASGKQFPLKGFSIDKLCHGVHGIYHSITITAHNDHRALVYKVEYSVWPVSGDLIAKNMLFSYEKAFSNKYYAMAIGFANDFGIVK